MDYVKPYGVVDSMLAGGALKLSLPPPVGAARDVGRCVSGDRDEHGRDGGRRNRLGSSAVWSFRSD